MSKKKLLEEMEVAELEAMLKKEEAELRAINEKIRRAKMAYKVAAERERARKDREIVEAIELKLRNIWGKDYTLNSPADLKGKIGVVSPSLQTQPSQQMKKKDKKKPDIEPEK